MVNNFVFLGNRKCGGTALDAPYVSPYRPFDEQAPRPDAPQPHSVRHRCAALPPYKNALRLQKFQKSIRLKYLHAA